MAVVAQSQYTMAKIVVVMNTKNTIKAKVDGVVIKVVRQQAQPPLIE